MPFNVKARRMRRRLPYARKPRAGYRKVVKRAPWKGINNFQSWSQPTKTPYSRVSAVTKHIDRTLLFRSFKPSSTVCQHRYVEELSLSSENVTGLTGAEYAFRLASLFDPNFTGVGHQPRGFDQMAAFYTEYVVYKVDVQVRIMSQTSGVNIAGNFVAISVRPFNNNSYSLGPARRYGELLEQPTNTIITMERDDICQNKTWDATFWIADIEGIPRGQIYQDTSYKAPYTANPTKTPYLSLAVGSTNELSGGNVKMAVSFVFHTLWSSPILVGQS